MQQLSYCNLFPRGHTFQGNTPYMTIGITMLTFLEKVDSDIHLPISCLQYVVKSNNYINENT